MSENRILSAYVKAGTRRRGIELAFAANGPKAYERKPMLWMEDRDHACRRRVRFDRMPGADGNRSLEGDAHSIGVPEGLDDEGMPTPALLAGVDRALDWRAHECARARLIGDLDEAPDWSRTIHVLALDAFRANGSKCGSGGLRMISETSGYLHGQLDIAPEVTLTDDLHGRLQIFMLGDLPETLLHAVKGRALREVVDAPWSRNHPDVTISHIHPWSTGGLRRRLVIHVDNVRTTLAPVPRDVDGGIVTPPGSRLAN